MKTILHFAYSFRSAIFAVLLAFTWNTSFGQQDIVINTTILSASVIEESDTESHNNDHLVISTDNTALEKYRNIKMKVLPVDTPGTISLNIISKRTRTMLVEIKNNADDELLFEPVHLKKGNNILSFNNDDASDVMFLKLSKMDSNNCASFIILKK